MAQSLEDKIGQFSEVDQVETRKEVTAVQMLSEQGYVNLTTKRDSLSTPHVPCIHICTCAICLRTEAIGSTITGFLF